MARFRADGVRPFAVPLALLMLLSACSGTPAGTPAGAPTGTSTGTSSGTPTASGLLGLELADLAAQVDPSADPIGGLTRQEAEDRARLRTQAGFAAAVGSGWEALSAGADAALDAAALSLAAKFSIDLPTASRSSQFASVVLPRGILSAPRAASAPAMALLGAALAAGQALGLPGTQELTVNETNTTTKGDSVTTIEVEGKGTATGTGSRVVAEFTFDLRGLVTNTVSGATAHSIGRAIAHVEIDGCPDANGSSKGKVRLSSFENLSSGQGWSRDLSGDFDIAVDDEANISKLTIDVQADESVDPTAESDGHELGIDTHVEYGAGPGFSGLSHNAGALALGIDHSKNATAADLRPLFTSALTSVFAGAYLLGQNAETFWRSGKCIEVVVAPAGGEVDANSVTEVVAKVRQRFEGNELTKPVAATLIGVKSVDPAGVKQPAPATFKYTAGPKPGDKGELQLESVSNRGIGTTSVTFTVKVGKWTTNADTPTGKIRGVKCEGIGGEWTVTSEEHLDAIVLTTVWRVTIDVTTLAGAYTFETTYELPAAGASTRESATGKAHIAVNQDGSVTMTLDPAPVTITTTFVDDDSTTVTIPGLGTTFPWRVDAAAVCA